MIKVENIEVWGFEHAIRGARNPLNSWERSDSEPAFHALENFAADDPMGDKYRYWNEKYDLNFKLGPNDLDLMQRLYKAGPEHRKYLRQIFVAMDITAPLYWWKEFDTYKIGTVSNSCSTMHKIHAKEFVPEDFSIEHLYNYDNNHNFAIISVEGNQCWYSPKKFISMLCEMLNYYRKQFIESKNKDDWWQMIQLLPSSYNQKRTITMNYENVMTMIKQRSGHKLDEWNTFVDILKTKLPYLQSIMGEEDDKVSE